MTLTFVRPALVAPTQLTLETGFSLGWTPGTAHHITKIDGWWSGAPMRRDKTDRVGAHGTFPERGYRDERLVSISAHYVAASRPDALAFLDQLNGFMGDGTEGLLVVNDAHQGARCADVYLAPGAVDADKYAGGVDVPYTVHMVAPDARKYAWDAVSGETGIPVPGGGLVTPLFSGPQPGVLNLGAGGVSGRVTLTNEGTADTGQLFIVSGADVPEFTITEVNTSRRLRYVERITTGQSLVLDSSDGSVTLDGYARRESKLLESQWTRLGPGETGSWLFEAPGSTDAKLSVVVYPAWW